jgi:predicted phosphodiesterase
MTTWSNEGGPPTSSAEGVRLAFVTDVHGDLHALEDALRIAADEGCEVVVCGGDVVDTGRYPNETIALLRARSIPTVRGNHDRWAVDRETKARDAGRFRELTDDSLEWLRGLPTEWTQVLRGVVVTVTHARPGSDFKGLEHRTPDVELTRLLDCSGATALLVGHTHEAVERRLSDGRLVANPGALLREPAPEAEPAPATGTMGILDLPSLRWRVVDVRPERLRGTGTE